MGGLGDLMGDHSGTPNMTQNHPFWTLSGVGTPLSYLKWTLNWTPLGSLERRYCKWFTVVPAYGNPWPSGPVHGMPGSGQDLGTS